MTAQTTITKQKRSWLQKCAIALIKFLGWKVHNITPPALYKKAVVVVAPHTSNWDCFYGMLFKLSHPEITLRFAIKKEVMFFPLSYLMRSLDAVPIDRKQVSKRKSMVADMTNMFNTLDDFVLVIAPEGTRSHVKRWKTGFYRLAQAANVPIILGYMNYAKKEMGWGPIFHPTDDMEKDIDSIKDFYRNIPGKYPEKGVI